MAKYNSFQQTRINKLIMNFNYKKSYEECITSCLSDI